MNRSVAQRLWLYGLLLLLPAVTIGGLALGLLARERERLAGLEAAALGAQRTAVEERARLIAENIELLVGDAQFALMTTLQEAPTAEPRAFLGEWQANNPLVRQVFRATADGRLVWGDFPEVLRAWLASGPPWADGIAGGVMRAEVQSAGGKPGLPTAKKDGAEMEKSNPPQLPSDADVRRDISSNILQYRRARQEIQQVAKLKNSADVLNQSVGEGLAAKRTQVYVVKDNSSAASIPRAKDTRELAAEPGLVSTPAASALSVEAKPAAPAEPTGDTFEVKAQIARANLSEAMPDSITRSGWTPWRDASGLHLFGWRELPDRTVIGIELRFDAITARLGEVFPAEPAMGEAYALRDTTGQAWHTIGAATLPVVLEVPLAGSALAGWTVVGQGSFMAESRSGAGGFFILGALLIGLLVLAILAAGAMLVRQARRSEVEAALKTSFVANVSHELKTPLTTIRLYAELLAQGRVVDEGKRSHYLVTIGQETQRLARLVGNVLDFSRLEQGKKKFERTTFDLAAELGRLADTHAPRLVEAGLSLGVALPKTAVVSTDRDAVEQVVLNLFDNACKYAADGGEVALALAPASGPRAGWQVSVGDRGPGVAAGQREWIFEKFHRVDDRLTAAKGGAGLGLSIARQLARGLGGELECREREGGGASFVLFLPHSDKNFNA
ncbi:MAG: HAMP domain-containing sensor histidine kinase [Verrucomicrobia bacterium]|nr:HAMP domain-containing sensor histidine kinase [Verrucomicrobiota bacterium]